jgi:hypothetical protein
VKPAGDSQWKIEARYAELEGRRLFYAVNFHDTPVQLRLDTPTGAVKLLRDSRDPRSSDPSPAGLVTIPPGQTAIYEIR